MRPLWIWSFGAWMLGSAIFGFDGDQHTGYLLLTLSVTFLVADILMRKDRRG